MVPDAAHGDVMIRLLNHPGPGSALRTPALVWHPCTTRPRTKGAGAGKDENEKMFGDKLERTVSGARIIHRWQPCMHGELKQLFSKHFLALLFTIEVSVEKCGE